MPKYSPDEKARILEEEYQKADKIVKEQAERERQELTAKKQEELITKAREQYLLKKDRITWQTTEDKDIHCTDFGNALRFMKHYGQSCLYCSQQNSWYLWNGNGYWKKDSLLLIEHMVREMLQNIYNETQFIGDPNDRMMLAKWAIQCEHPQHIQSCLKELMKMPSISCTSDKFDTDKFLFNLQNGTYDLKSHLFLQHDRENYITRQVSYKYDPGQSCPKFLAFLDRLFQSLDTTTRAEILQYIQKAVGYSLTGDTGKQIIFLLHGSGANGKSTLIEILRKLMGEYSTTISANTLTTKKNDSVRNDIARLLNVRFVATSENAMGTVLDEELIKNLTGGDQVAARFLFQEEFVFHPQLKLWWAFNHPPGIRDMTHSLWRRLKMIPFKETIPESEQVPQKELMVMFDPELPGIFNWAIEGLKMFQSEGLKDVSEVTGAVQEFKEDQDRLYEFMEYNCDDVRVQTLEGQIGSDVTTSVSVLYESYKSLATYNNEKVMSQRRFSMELLNRGFKKSHSRIGNVFHGIRLKKFN